MTVSSEEIRKAYNGAGTVGPFTVPYRFLDDADLLVIKTEIATGASSVLALTTDYTLTGEGSAAGGELTLTAALPATHRITIINDPDGLQDIDYTPFDPFPAETHERGLDKLAIRGLRLRDLINRSFRQPDGDVDDIGPMPAAVVRALKALVFDSLGNPIAADISGSAISFSPTTESFDGTGAQVAFILSGAPNTASALIVRIDGVVQTPITDFTVSGVTLTFTTAPATGTGNIVVQNFGIAAVVDTVGVDNVTGLSASTGASKVGADDGASGSLFTTVAGFIARLLSSVGSSLVGFLQSGIAAIASDTQSKIRNIEYSAWDDMTTAQRADVAARTALVDVAGAINSAIVAVQAAGGFEVQLPHGKLLIASKISVPTSVVLRGHSRGTTVVKGFNGDCFEVASFGSLRCMDIDGNSGSFTGRGVIITEGTNPTGGKQFFFDVNISNTESFNFEYTADGVGFESVWLACRFSIPDNDIYCGKLPVDTGTGNRKFIACHAPADSILDLNGAGNTFLVGCGSGRSSAGNLWCLGYADTSAQNIASGCRLAGGGQTGVIKGTLNAITGGSIAATGITFASSATKNVVRSNPTGSITWTDSSGSTGVDANEFDENVTVYAPTVTAATTAPTNFTINGSRVRNGRMVTLAFTFTCGAGFTEGVGEWRFSLPYTAGNRQFEGTARIKDASGNNYIAAVEIVEGGATTCRIQPHGSAAAIQASVPITWVETDVFHATVTYYA
jgi:hypothetical protein